MIKITKPQIQKFHTAFKMERDPWQVDVIHKTCNMGEYYLSGPRQIGKTTLASDLALILASRGLRVLYLTHRKDNAVDVLNRVLAYARPMKTKGIVSKISVSNGFEEVNFASGGSIKFRTRVGGVSVGLTLDAIIWDEAQKVDPSIVAEIDPILSQSKYRIQFFMGTPPTEDDLRLYPDGPFLRAKLKGGEKWREFSAAEEYNENIEISLANARKANPAWKRTPDFWNAMLKSAEKLDHKQFCGQYLGVWSLPKVVEIHEPYLSPNKVEKMMTKKGSSSTRFVASVGISPKANKAFISMNDGNTVEIAARLELEMGGLDDVVDWIKERIRSIQSVRLPSTARGKAVAEMLKAERLGGKVKIVTLPEFSTNLSRFFKQAEEGSLKIFKERQVELALSSFWLGFEPRSGSYDVKSGIPEDELIVMSLVNSVMDGSAIKRSAVGPTSRGGKAFAL